MGSVRRGLTRLYVVLWVLGAALGAVLAWASWSPSIADERTLAEYIREHETDAARLRKATTPPQLKANLHMGAKQTTGRADSVLMLFPGDIALVAVPAERVEEARSARWGAVVYADEAQLKQEQDALLSVQAIALSDAVVSPSRYFVSIWGTWLLLSVLAPLVLLRTIGWIADGFRKDGAP